MTDFESGQTASGILFILFALLVVSWLAKKYRFFSLPPPSSHVPLNFKQTLGSFLVYFGFAWLILPIILVAITLFRRTAADALQNPAPAWLGWLQLAALAVIFLLLILYVFCIKSTTRHYIFWGEKEKGQNRFLKGVGMGVLSWIVSYPFVLAMGALTRILSLAIWGKGEVEQVAVKQLKMTMDRPDLFVLMIIAIVFLVPFTEELLFRGFLQNFLKKYLPRFWALTISAALFACAHFALSQGVGNFRLLLTLLVLSLFLGFIYEKERTLWAPIAMHSTFNAISILLIILG